MFKFKLIIATLICLTSFLFANTAWAEKFPRGDFEALKNTVAANVVEVINPYTLKLSNGQTLRLVGVHYIDYTPDAPGTFSLLGMKILKDMVEGRSVEIYQTKNSKLGRVNRMGHILGHVRRVADGAWVQGSLVTLGVAAVKTSKRNPEMAAQMYALETIARKNKRGVWAKDLQVLKPTQAEKHMSSFQIIEGTVASVALKKNRIYLNFGKNWRDDFTVSIAAEDRKSFTKTGVNPMDWNKQPLRIRGWVEDYNGAYIEINHPAAIEVLK